MNMPGALAGVRVLDVTIAWAGPYCSMMLADMGAEVIKIENAAQGRGGARGGFPQIAGEDATFMMFNRNKKGLAVNLKDKRGQEVVHRLAKTADIFVQNFRPGVVKRLNVDYETLRQINPALVYCSISAFGQGSPWEHLPGNNALSEAASGVMSCVGMPGGPPVTGIPIGDIGGGLTAAYGILAAYIHRLRTGEGQLVETSLTDVLISWLVAESIEYWVLKRVPQPMGSAACHRLTRGTQAYECADGKWMVLRAGTGRDSIKLCELLGIPGVGEDPRFATSTARFQNGEEFIRLIQERVRTRPRDEWLALMLGAGLPAMPVHTVDQVLEGEHAKAREMCLEYEHPRAGHIRQLGIPIKMSRTPTGVRAPSPAFGEHTEELLRSVGYSAAELEALREEKVVA